VDNKVIRVAVVADSHFDTTSRFEECVRIHEWIADDIRKRGVQLLLHAGDVFERKSNPVERNAVAEWLTNVAEHCPVVIVRGNHDVVGDLAIFGKLEARHPITVVEDARVVDAYPRDVTQCAVLVACVSWPRKAELLARMIELRAEIAKERGEDGPALPPTEEIQDVAGDMLRSVLRGLGAQMRVENEGDPKILLMHAMVCGSVTSTGQPLVGCDMEVGLEDLGLVDADFYALGHIHKGQEWSWNSRPIIYPGSPRRTAFGELEEKDYLIVEFTPIEEEVNAVMTATTRWDVRVERVPTPCAPMLLLEGDYVEAVGGEVKEFVWRTPVPLADPPFVAEKLAGAEIRLRYHVPADKRPAAKLLANTLADTYRTVGAVDVKVEEVVIPTTMARAPAIARAVTLEEKLQLYWDARDFNPSTERAEALLTKLHQLEMEVQHATGA
jgi:DNA repair protein SbcD/Mre11